jgi:hypothetical protein
MGVPPSLPVARLVQVGRLPADADISIADRAWLGKPRST